MNRKIFGARSFFSWDLPLFFILIMIIPFLLGLYYSFTNWNGVSSKIDFVGFDNFVTIFTNDDKFRDAFWFTTRFTVLGVILTNLLGFLLAYFLTKPLKTRNVLRTIFFMPNVIGGLLGFIWQFIFVKGFARSVMRPTSTSSICRGSVRRELPFGQL